MRNSFFLSLLLFLPFAYGWAENASQDTSESLFNSCWRNEQTGDWQLSLFDSCAIYDSKMWKYATKTEKKVVLTDGNTKVNIEIGKNKNGKSDFVIDGKKVSLSKITTETLPDYPTIDFSSFSTDIKPGEVTLMGYLKDIPEEYSFGKIYIEAYVADYINACKMKYEVAVDKDGFFKLTVPVFGINMIELWARNGSDYPFFVPMISEGGNSYFLLHDFSSKRDIFMGKDARLQNELQHKWNVVKYRYERYVKMSEEQATEYFYKINDEYEDAKKKMTQTIQEHPTISKRYRDGLSTISRYASCCRLKNLFYAFSELPKAVSEWICENGELDPEMPLTLTEVIGLNVPARVSYEGKKIFNSFFISNIELLNRIENGQLKLSDDDVELLKLWIARDKEHTVCDTIENPKVRSAMRDLIDSKYPVRKLIDFWNRSDIERLQRNGAPAQREIEKSVIDSLCLDKKLHDFALSLWLMRNMRIAEEGLPKELFKYIDEVKDTFLLNKIYERHYRLANAANQKFPEVEASTRPSSDVKGLTDGKAILEKILEPFKGRFVHIDFWGTWCGGCMQQMQHTPMLKSELKDYDMVYLYFANNSKYADWIRKINDLNVYGRNCVHYNLPKEQENALETYLDVFAFPAYFLVDKQGNIHNLGNSLSESIPKAKRIMEK